MTVRRAQSCDFAAIHALESACFSDSWSKEALQNAQRGGITEFVVIEDDGVDRDRDRADCDYNRDRADCDCDRDCVDRDWDRDRADCDYNRDCVDRGCDRDCVDRGCDRDCVDRGCDRDCNKGDFSGNGDKSGDGSCDGKSGGIFGYAMFSVILEDAEIMSVAVAPQRRGCGAGRALMRTVLARAAERGATQCFLEVRSSNVPARALYASLGFTEVRTIRSYYRHPTEDAVVMCRALP